MSTRGSIRGTDIGALPRQCSPLASQAIRQLVSSMPDWSMAKAEPGHASRRTITPRHIACLDWSINQYGIVKVLHVKAGCRRANYVSLEWHSHQLRQPLDREITGAI